MNKLSEFTKTIKSKGMKILFTTYSISGGTGGGAERLLSIMANYWTKLNNNIVIISFDGGNNENEFFLEKEIIKIPLEIAQKSNNSYRGIVNNIKRIFILRKTIKQNKPDIIISFTTNINILTNLASWGLWIPTISFELSDPYKIPDKKIWRLLRRFVYYLSTWIVVQNKHALNFFLPHFKKKTSIIHNPALSYIGEIDVIKRNNNLIVAMASLEFIKGLDILLKSLALLRNDYPDIILKIMGDGTLREELQQLTVNLGIENNVKFLGWINNPFEIMKEASFFVLSSRYEGFPMSILEALSCGLPAISTDCPSGPREIIRDGIDGILTPNEDINALYSAMEKLLSNKNLRMKMAENALEVTSRFSIEKIMFQWNELINNIKK